MKEILKYAGLILAIAVSAYFSSLYSDEFEALVAFCLVYIGLIQGISLALRNEN